MTAEQFQSFPSTNVAGAWVCPDCRGTFLGAHHHDQSPRLVADPLTLGRIADSLERIAKALERREERR